MLLALSDTGFGHRAAAHAVLAATRDRLGDQVRAEVLDVYGELDVPLLRSGPTGYGLASRYARPVFDLGFGLTDRPSARPLLAAAVKAMAQRRVEDLLRARRPDTVVVCNPFYMGDLFAAARRNGAHQFALATLVTDPVTVHRSWFSAEVDLHLLVGRPRTAPATGFACRRVPFPVHPAFARRHPGRELARRQLGLDPARPVALVAGGGAGSGARRTWRALLEALAADAGLQLLVAVGTNSETGALLRHPRFASARVLAPTGSLELPLRACSAVFSKAGPATIFEAAALGVPLRLFDEVGPQERGNTAYAAALGLAEPLADQDPAAFVRAAEAWTRRPRPELTGGAAAVADWIVST